jgi:DNA-binding NarL/FixJ family response regulator
MIDIVITSDIRIYCEGLGQILADTQELNVLDIAGNYEAAIASISTCKPAIVLLDMTMAGSCQMARHIVQISPKTKIVALAVSYDESNIMQCAEAGITCYVPREASVSELIDAVKEAAKGECYCPPKIAACLLKKVQHLATSATSKYLTASGIDPQPRTNPASGKKTRLTRREIQIARLLAEGMSNKVIARSLTIEVSTVKNHVHNLFVKLEVHSRSQAVFRLQEDFFRPVAEPLDLDPFVNMHF